MLRLCQTKIQKRVAAKLTYTKSALNCKSLLCKAEGVDVQTLLNDQGKLEELSCANAILWSSKFAPADSLDGEAKEKWTEWKTSDFFGALKAVFEERLAALNSKVLGCVRERVRSATAATTACARGTSSQEQCWKAGLTEQSSFMDVVAAAEKINTAGLATHFKQLKKDLVVSLSQETHCTLPPNRATSFY